MPEALGKHWVLLRGLARESAHWGDFIPMLQNSFPKSLITLLDLPGSGSFYRETSPDSILEITNRVRNDALHKQALNQPVTLLAQSLGAMVAWEWMRRYPEDICGAALINTSFADLSPFYLRLRWQSYQNFLALIFKQNLRARERGILQLVCNRRDRDDEITESWTSIQQQRPIALKNVYRQVLAALRYKSGNFKPSQTVLLLSGLGDRLVSPSCSEAIQKRTGFKLITHADAGHDMTIDDGEWVALQLKTWAANQNL